MGWVCEIAGTLHHKAASTYVKGKQSHTAGSLVKQHAHTNAHSAHPHTTTPWCVWQTPTSRRLYETHNHRVDKTYTCLTLTSTHTHSDIMLIQKYVFHTEQLKYSVLKCNYYGLLLWCCVMHTCCHLYCQEKNKNQRLGCLLQSGCS